MNNYNQKYLKYKKKYLSMKKQNGGNKLIIHISGSQGSGKTTMGNQLKDLYGDKITVMDLDDMNIDYQNNKDKYESYQKYIDLIIDKNQSKPLIFVGLDAEMCLGSMDNTDIYYDLKTTHAFYIKSSSNTLEQRFFRQIDKLNKRKEWFFDEWQKNPQKTQDKLFRFVDLNKWKDNNDKCDKLYSDRKYEILDFNDILKTTFDILDKHI